MAQRWVQRADLRWWVLFAVEGQDSLELGVVICELNDAVSGLGLLERLHRVYKEFISSFLI